MLRVIGICCCLKDKLRGLRPINVTCLEFHSGTLAQSILQFLQMIGEMLIHLEHGLTDFRKVAHGSGNFKAMRPPIKHLIRY